MSISDERFELKMRGLEELGFADEAEQLRERDTAQREALGAAIEGAMKWEQDLKDAREALVRVEAERDSAQLSVELWKEQYQSVVDFGNEIMAERDTAQQQLAQAVVLLEHAMESSSFREILTLERDIAGFLARHAQAAQQEALSDAELMEVAMFTGSGNKAARRANALGAAELPKHLAPQQDAQGAQAGEFQREDRYIVIKRKDLEAAPFKDRVNFLQELAMLEAHLPKREYLVIESGWPEYEPTWAAIQARVEGRAALAAQPAVRGAEHE